MQLKKFWLSLTLVLAMLAPQVMKAQQLQPLPIDPEVRMGVLPNGLTYIVRKNSEPKGRANYYIAQKVGSILENDNQQGLAHFLEHMAFNGTKNFPGKNLISFLERIGCRFGADLNAYTAFDETVYTIMDAPTNEGKDIIDSCILILHDWSNNITLDDKEIDEERGVIHEEWRSRNNADLRTMTKMIKETMPGNKYANRMPIGTMDVVLHFPHKAIKDFYHKWYRPDLQGIIIVGDFDPDYVVAKLKEYFKDVPKPVNPAERYYVPVADNDTPIASVATDKESTQTRVQVMYKHDPLPRNEKATIIGVMDNYMQSIATSIINERFEEIAQKANAPFIAAGAYDGDFMGIARTKEALTFVAITNDGGAEKALTSLAQEIHRLREFGVLPGEYERAKINLLKQYENLYNERAKRSNTAYTEEYKDYFIHGGYIPGIALEKQLMEQIAAAVTPQQVSEYIKEMITTGKNLVITVTGPEKKNIKYPSKAELIKLYTTTFAKPVAPLKEEVSNTKLLDKEPTGGQIVSEKTDPTFGVTELKLSNGITVYIKPTEFKDNSISMRGITEGGYGLYNKTPNDILNSKVINDYALVGGLGKFDKIALGKALTGKSAGCTLNIAKFTTSLSGSSTKEDLETMLQLAYLTFTDIRKDQQAFETEKQKSLDMLKMQERNPLFSLGDSMIKLIYNDAPDKTRLKVEDYQRINYDRILQMTRERLASADGFKFFFVGNVDLATAKPLIVKYLGSLPKGKATPKMDRTKDDKMRTGTKTMNVTKETDTPMAITMDILSSPAKYDLKNMLKAEILNGVIDQVLIASIREREGGTYSPQASVGVNEYPVQQYVIMVQFFSDPQKAKYLNDIVYKEFNNIATNGIPQVYFDKTVTNMKKVYAENQRSNGYWLGQLVSYYFFNKDFHHTYETTLNSITPKDIQNVISEIMKSNNRLELFFTGNAKEAAKK